MSGISIRDISEEDFALWRNHPVTRVVRRYLSDYADALGKAALDEFIAGGNLNDARQLEIRGRILAALEASDLQFEAVVSFYQKDEAESGAETSQN